MHNTKPSRYTGPVAKRIGSVEELTSGNGEIEVDYLGNTSTYYGRWIGIAEERKPDLTQGLDEGEESSEDEGDKKE